MSLRPRPTSAMNRGPTPIQITERATAAAQADSQRRGGNKSTFTTNVRKREC
jgi:hypothetical protein